MRTIKKIPLFLLLAFLAVMLPGPLSAHCDSYDGPLIKDALKAIDMNQVAPVLKWIEPKHETEITALFNKTVSLKNGDKEIYAIVEKHFLETLVRLHREGEGASFTGLKPAGSASAIVLLADGALADKDVESLIVKLNGHIAEVVREKYREAAEKALTKDNSTMEGRAYVKAYIEYTHLLEALHGTLETDHAHSAHAE